MAFQHFLKAKAFPGKKASFAGRSEQFITKWLAVSKDSPGPEITSFGNLLDTATFAENLEGRLYVLDA